ncbi:MAG: ATP-binding protein, partial [Bacilli bacterium]
MNEENTQLTEQEKRRLEAAEKQKRKVEQVATDEGSKKPSEPVKKAAEEVLPTENFEEEHISHVDLNEQQEETAMKAKEEYTGKDIEILQGLEAVRQRPGMYIGTTSSKGLHHLVREAVDNGIDEALAGYCKHIRITILPPEEGSQINRIRVEDDGRGIPCDINSKTGLSTVETVYTVLHAGGKFNDKTGYKISGGLHGVGVKAVNALSTKVKVTVYREGNVHEICFENGGNTVQPGLQIVGRCPIEKTGTSVEFTPDPTIFKETTVFDFSSIDTYIRQTAFLTTGLDMTLDDVRVKDEPKHSHYYYDGGIKEYVAYINETKDKVFDSVFFVSSSTNDKTLTNGSTIIVECALQPTKGGIINMNSFCNNIRTVGGGTHEEGFRLAIGRELNSYFRGKDWLKDSDDNFRSEDCMEGLTI